MPLYRCMLRGENFPGRVFGQDEPQGFYTTRFVEADSPEQAELAAVQALRDDPDLAVAPEHRTPDARVFLESIEEVPADTERVPNRGFTFFPMEGADGSRAAGARLRPLALVAASAALTALAILVYFLVA